MVFGIWYMVYGIWYRFNRLWSMVYVIQEYGVKESRLPPRLLGGSIRPCTLQHCVWAVKSGPVSKPRLKASLGVMDYGLWIMGYG